MRLELFYNPVTLIERLAEYFYVKKRFRKLKNSEAKNLNWFHIGSMELLELIKDDIINVVYDIGANSGTWTTLCKVIIPRAKVYCFEPLSDILPTLAQNISKFDNVSVCPVGVGNENTNKTLIRADDSSSILSLNELQKITFKTVVRGEETIRVVKLDDFVRDESLPIPDLIKMDIQGYELEALKGAVLTLTATSYVLLEVSFQEFYQGQPLFGEIAAFMHIQGFELIAINKETPLGARILQTDVLFENRKIVK